MADRRKDDNDPAGRTWFRTERLVQQAGEWFFITRENSLEGPFECREDALERLETYKRVIDLGLLPDDATILLEE